MKGEEAWDVRDVTSTRISGIWRDIVQLGMGVECDEEVVKSEMGLMYDFGRIIGLVEFRW